MLTREIEKEKRHLESLLDEAYLFLQEVDELIDAVDPRSPVYGELLQNRVNWTQLIAEYQNRLAELDGEDHQGDKIRIKITDDLESDYLEEVDYE